jgi:hypothetical protein
MEEGGPLFVAETHSTAGTAFQDPDCVADFTFNKFIRIVKNRFETQLF